MNAAALIARLAAGRDAIPALLAGVSDEQARWRPAPEQWSLLEIACHLLDEERDDFRTRVELTLHRPDETWPGIDPPGWVTARRYQERALAVQVEAWREERGRSLAWLRALEAPDWTRTHAHPKFGPLSAGDLLLSWVAHDQLHVRQIARRHFEHAAALGAPHSTRYAGDW